MRLAPTNLALETHMKAIVTALTISLVLSLSASRLTAQPAPDDGKLAVLVNGLGSYSRPISTKSELEGELLLARGRHDEAVKAFEAAVKLQDELKYIEPPDWGQSMRLYLGAALLKAGRAREAELVYREDLKDFNNDGWTLFGLSQSLRAQGKSAEARKVEENFQRAWKNADVTLKASVF
jgi:tetratricopeptide (TPR) repeat protein